jgi:hypothetical protein
MLNRIALVCLFGVGLTVVPVFGQSAKCVIETTQNGTMVKVRGVVFPGGHDMFMRPEQCPDNRVILTYGDDPTLGRDRLQMKRDAAFQEFEHYLREQQPSKPNEICQQCPKYQVEAELSGRLDIAPSAGVKRNAKTGKATGLEGYGHPLPFTRFRLVITSVATVTAKELPIIQDKAPEKKQ